MSLNKFCDPEYETAKPWMNIRCNQLSFGEGPSKLRTQAYAPTVTADWGTITSTPPVYYTSDYTSLRIKGHINFETATAPQNFFNIEVKLPGELVSRFGTGSAINASGYMVEHPVNTNQARAYASSATLSGTNDGVIVKFFLDSTVSTQYLNRIYFDIGLFKP